jgi:hypothetical protein
MIEISSFYFLRLIPVARAEEAFFRKNAIFEKIQTARA